MNSSPKKNLPLPQNNLNEQMQYWDSVAAEKKFHTQFDAEIFIKYVNPTDVVLDFGCGYGRILGELIKYKFNHLYGADFSEQMLDLARKTYPNVIFKKNNDIDISYQNEFFDAIILSAVLGCIAGESQQKYLIKEILRVLKPGGILYLADFIINDDEYNLKRYQEFPNSNEFPYGVFHVAGGAVLRHHTEEHIRQILSQFDIKIFHKTTFKTMDNKTSNGFILIAKKL